MGRVVNIGNLVPFLLETQFLILTSESSLQDTLLMPDGNLLPMRSLYKEVGRLIRAHRTKLELSQSVLARQVGHTRTSITNIEAGRQRVSLDLLFTFARVLNIEARELLPSTTINLPPDLKKKIPRQYDESQVRALKRVVTG
jgi:DNA-binding XRE family transcriptional regulator